jgi:hypothetical protein
MRYRERDRYPMRADQAHGAKASFRVPDDPSKGVEVPLAMLETPPLSCLFPNLTLRKATRSVYKAMDLKDRTW